MNNFAFDTDDTPAPSRRRTPQPAGPNWLHTFSAVLAANLCAAFLLGLFAWIAFNRLMNALVK